MRTTDEERHEAHLRRRARAHGLALRKFRGRNPQAPESGTFLVVDVFTNSVVYGGEWATPGQVEWLLDEYDKA